ncbi:MAG: hypothetical protein NW224_11980 [Leptolyngbyaceae cyanobacterium bins.302]|nr:hypothetical protein [Leptolyngbyaceae cyanobacterium bins.302]
MDYLVSHGDIDEQQRRLTDLEAWLDATEPEIKPIPPTCGMCSYHRSHPWEYCSLRAAADVHPCNLKASSPKAETCPFFEMDCPF